MPNLSANLTMLFTEVDFLDRFKLASQAGFKAIEYLFPYQWDKQLLADKIKANHLLQTLHNIPAGDWSAGDRGIACIPGREGEFQDGVGKAIEYAKALECPKLNCLAGVPPEDADPEKVRQILVDNLIFAAKALEKEGITMVVEALNNLDVPGFYFVHIEDILTVKREIGQSNIYVQYDVYHMQIMEGNLINTINRNISEIGHIQIADNPGRHEPGTGEINFPNLFKAIDQAGYDGWIGCEYVPATTTAEGLGWVKPYL